MKNLTYEEFLEEVIQRGIAGAERDYKDPVKLRGAVQGFYDCKGHDPKTIVSLLHMARSRRELARLHEDPLYWEHRAREAEIEWVCNVLGAYAMFTHNEELAQLVVKEGSGTVNAVVLAGQILGVK